MTVAVMSIVLGCIGFLSVGFVLADSLADCEWYALIALFTLSLAFVLVGASDLYKMDYKAELQNRIERTQEKLDKLQEVMNDD